MTLRIMTLSMMTFNVMTHSITGLSGTQLNNLAYASHIMLYVMKLNDRITASRTRTLSITIPIGTQDITQHVFYTLYHKAVCHYTE
jgi:hypothetical protein